MKRRTPPRSDSTDSLAELTLQAGMEVLFRDGLQLRPDSISYAKVFSHLERHHGVRVTRASVHNRIWRSHEDFRRDVMAEALDHLPVDALTPEQLAGLAAVSSERGASATAIAGGDYLWQAALDSSLLIEIQSFKAIASRFNDPVAAEVLHDQLNNRDQLRLARRARALSGALTSMGRRIDPRLGLSDRDGCWLLTVLGDMLLTGGHLNYRAGCSDLSVATGYLSDPDGRQRPTSLFGLAMAAFLELVTEPAGPNEPPMKPDFEIADRPRPRRWPTPGAPSASSVSIDPVAFVAPAGSVASGGGRPSNRRSRQELRSLVLAAGRELLLRDGLALKPEALGYSSVLGHLEQTRGVVVNRASIHGRVWPSNEHFCYDVLTRVIETSPRSGLGIDPGRDSSPPLRVEDFADRRDYVLQQTRQALAYREERFKGSHDYRMRLLIKAALVDRADTAEVESLRYAVTRTDAERLQFNQGLVAAMVTNGGFRVRPESGLGQDEAVAILTTIVQAVMTGVMLNHLCGVTTGDQPFELGSGADGRGPRQRWTVSGLAQRACIELLFEQRPDR